MYRKYGMPREGRTPVAAMYRKYGMPREGRTPLAAGGGVTAYNE